MAYGTLCGLEVINYLAQRGSAATSREISEATGITRATAYRTLDELVGAGWLVAEGSPRRFLPSWHVTGIGLRMLLNNHVREIALRSVIDLAVESGRRAFLSFQDGPDTVFTDAVEVVGGRCMPASVYSRLPVLLTASGRATLSRLPAAELERLIEAGIPQMVKEAPASADHFRAEVQRARQRGYGVSYCEVEPDLVSIAAPVLDVSGQPVAAIGLSYHQAPSRAEFEERHAESVRQWARRASIELGHRATGPFG